MSKKKDSSSRCALCGRHVGPLDPDCITGATGNKICRDCLSVANRIAPVPQEDASLRPPVPVLLPPHLIVQELDKVIIGQKRAKNAIAIALWKQQLRASGDMNLPRTNLLLYGPTGCGKTALVREAAKIVGLPFITFDATTLSEAGYRGRDASELVTELIDRHLEHLYLDYGVIFLDEIDKLAATGGEPRMQYNRGTQHSLLKLIEGIEINYRSCRLSTDSLLFIFGGAFTGISDNTISTLSTRPIGFMSDIMAEQEDTTSDITIDDFVSFGMEPELLGRVGQCVPVEPLTAQDLKQILLESQLSPYLQYQKFFASRGIQLEFSNKYMDRLANQAFAQGSGARGLNRLVEETVEPLLLRLAAGEIQKTLRLD